MNANGWQKRFGRAAGTPPGIGPRRAAVYNSRIVHMCSALPDPSGRLALLLLALVLLPASLAHAADWNVPAQEFARKIAAVTGPAPVSVDGANRSGLGKKEVEQILLAVRAQLAGAGVREVAPEQATAAVQVTISENLQNYVWVAEIRQGSELATVMISTPRPDTTFPRDESSAFSLRKVPLWSQEERILDVAVLQEGTALVEIAVLDPEKVAIYRFADNRWRLEQSLGVMHARIWPRDMRGRLIPRQDHLLDIYLPGVFCQTPASAPLSLVCRESDDPWPLASQFPLGGFFAPTRNFFTGALSPGIGKQVSTVKFYTAAPVPHAAYTLWILAGVDGSLHLLDGVSEQTASLAWGSDVATIKTSCGSGWQVLATQAGDGAADSVRAYQFADREPVAVTPPLELGGGITALWTEANGSMAVVVSRSRSTGTYEAFRLVLGCGS